MSRLPLLARAGALVAAALLALAASRPAIASAATDAPLPSAGDSDPATCGAGYRYECSSVVTLTCSSWGLYVDARGQVAYGCVNYTTVTRAYFRN